MRQPRTNVVDEEQAAAGAHAEDEEEEPEVQRRSALQRRQVGLPQRVADRAPALALALLRSGGGCQDAAQPGSTI